MAGAKKLMTLMALSLLGLILVSVLMVSVLDAGALTDPTVPPGGAGPAGEGPTGYLVVDMFSNTNENSKLSLPTANSTYPIGEWPVTVSYATHSASSTVYPMVTDSQGGAEQTLPAGSYVVSFTVEAVTVNVPVTVQVQNVTRAVINVTGTAFPIVYSEESPGSLTKSGAESTMFVLVAGPPPVNKSESVVIKSQDAAEGPGEFADATVTSQGSSSQGSGWLQLSTQQPFDPVNATSIYLTTWTYSASVTTTVDPSNGFSVDLRT